MTKKMDEGMAKISKPVNISMTSILPQITVDIKITYMWLFKRRLLTGLYLLRLAQWVMGVNVHVDVAIVTDRGMPEGVRRMVSDINRMND